MELGAAADRTTEVALNFKSTTKKLLVHPSLVVVCTFITEKGIMPMWWAFTLSLGYVSMTLPMGSTWCKVD